MTTKDIFIMHLSGTANYKNKKEIYFPDYYDPIDNLKYGKNGVTIQFLNNKAEDYIIRIYCSKKMRYQDIFKNNKPNGISLVYCNGEFESSVTFVDGIKHGPYKHFEDGVMVKSVFYKNKKL